jgi:hypothetical protein
MCASADGLSPVFPEICLWTQPSGKFPEHVRIVHSAQKIPEPVPVHGIA